MTMTTVLLWRRVGGLLHRHSTCNGHDHDYQKGYCNRDAATQQYNFAQQISFHQFVSFYCFVSLHTLLFAVLLSLDAQNRAVRRDYQQYDSHVQHSPYALETCHAIRFWRSWLPVPSHTRRFAAIVSGRRVQMLWTIFIMLLILWFLGLVSSYTLGGYIHILIVVALIVLVVNLVTGRRGAA